MFDKVLSKMFSSEQYGFDEVHVEEEVIDAIVEMGISSDPYEFMCLFDGEIKDNILHITGLIFLPTETSSEGALMQTGMLPPTMSNLGSVHSHPGPSAMPSGTDLVTFSKMGLFHMIICRPYNIEDIISYNRFGEVIKYKIVNEHTNDSKVLDDLLEYDDLLEDDELTY